MCKYGCDWQTLYGQLTLGPDEFTAHVECYKILQRQWSWHHGYDKIEDL